MRNSIYYISVFACILLAFLSCEKDVPSYVDIDSYEFKSVDDKGGTWKPVLLTAPTDIQVAAPAADINAEIIQLQSIIKNATSDDIDAAKYWSQNPIIRWNEIARELAAKYNLPPAPLADGTYPQPNPAKPADIPNFPFAHPPYASRAFAYLSAASFDGLITAWHYKYLYNRKPLHVIDPTITTLFPKNDLPSYPSDGAVVTSIARDILTAMFPLEKEFILAKSIEANKSLMVAGLNVQSDIDAGDKIGKEIAVKFLARASTDGLKKAQTSKAVSDSIKNVAQAKYGWAWFNMESPVRPVGIAPLFGKLKTWAVDDVVNVRPIPPPAIGSAAYDEAAEELKGYSKKLTAEQRRIANWWADGPSTYTPPGHWNRLAADIAISEQLNPLRSARLFAYLNMAMQDAGISCWDAKYHYYYPRPINVMDGFKSNLGTPNFPGYTSGHSSFSGAAASVIGHLFPNQQQTVDAFAKEASDSRVYGCIHFRFDCTAGLEQGTKVAAYTIAKAKVDGAN